MKTPNSVAPCPVSKSLDGTSLPARLLQIRAQETTDLDRSMAARKKADWGITITAVSQGCGSKRSRMAETSGDVIQQSVGLRSLNWVPLPEVATFSMDEGRSFVRSLEDKGVRGDS